jgi:hypothetical protein
MTRSAEESIEILEENLTLYWGGSFRENMNLMARQGYAAENLATARQIALNLLKQDTTEKLGIKNKRKACGRSDRYLFHILGLIK